jgi:hypothetical protein
MQNYSVLVNTCDKFEDCWDPFFKLFSIYWPDYNCRIFLNTEYKDYSYPGLDIIAVKGCAKHNIPRNVRATWSQCLKWALESIDDEIVLYMQEDYFLKDMVKDDVVNKYVSLMRNNKDIHCIHLTDQAVTAEKKSQYENLYEVALKQRYRVSCQAALWRNEVLMSYIREYESAWQFEEFGSKRAAILQHNFYVVDENWVKLNEFEIIPYVFTGIIQGYWYERVIPLFEKHNIVVDYSLRGFVNDTPKKPLNKRLLYNWNKIPILLKHCSDVRGLKRNKLCK